MNNLEIIEIFTKEDIEFNRKMVNRGMSLQSQKKVPEKRGGKMSMRGRKRTIMSEEDYDFTSDVLSAFREKWGISE